MLGPLIMSPSEQKLSARSPSSEKSSLGYGHRERRIDSQTGSIVSGKLFQVGSEDSLSSSRQGSLTSDQLQFIPIETQDFPAQHSSQDTLGVESDQGIPGHGESLIQIEEEERDVSEDAKGAGSSHLSLQMDPEKSLSGKIPPLSVAIEDLRGGNLNQSEWVDGGDGVNKEVAQHVGLELEQDDQEIETGEVCLLSCDVPHVSEQASGADAEAGVGWTLASSDTVGLGTGAGIGVVGVADQALVDTIGITGSIMLADSNLSLDMTAIPCVGSQDQLGPSSPVLPTDQMEEMVQEGETLLVSSGPGVSGSDMEVRQRETWEAVVEEPGMESCKGNPLTEDAGTIIEI